MTSSSYLGLVSSLPLPSREQTRQFAEYVSEAHNWCKHLPIHPSSRFLFFLDPNAGRRMVRRPRRLWSRGFEDVEDIIVGNTQFPSSNATTKMYRSRFGYWNFFVPNTPSRWELSLEGLVDNRPNLGPVVIDSRKCSVPIPGIFVDAGTARVTSLIHPGRAIHWYWAMNSENTNTRLKFPEVFDHPLEGFPESLRSAVISFIRSPWDIHILKRRVYPLLEQAREVQLQVMEDAMHKFVRLVSDSANPPCEKRP